MNIGRTTVTVTKLMRTCVCSDAKIDKQEIKPGESAKVSFTISVWPTGPAAMWFRPRFCWPSSS